MRRIYYVLKEGKVLPKQLPTTYDPHGVEEKWYQVWESKGYFKAPLGEDLPEKKQGGGGNLFDCNAST